MVLGNKGRLKGDALRNLKARHEYRQEKERKKKKTAQKSVSSLSHRQCLFVRSRCLKAVFEALDINRFVTLTWHELRLRWFARSYC